MKLLAGLLLLAGVALVTSPWWSATLPRTDYPLVIALGVIFGGGGVFIAIPEDRAPRWRTLAFCLRIGAFGLVCAAIALAPFHPDAGGTYRIAGIPGFVGASVPWWARIVAGGFALLLLGAAGAGLWGLARGGSTGDPDA
ncbi:MAG: hypothetical protein U1F41_03895 [Burkholderiales bacterium]